VADNYDRYYGRPSSKTLDKFQNAVKKIQKKLRAGLISSLWLAFLAQVLPI
jgi:hypothetical protein